MENNPLHSSFMEIAHARVRLKLSVSLAIAIKNIGSLKMKGQLINQLSKTHVNDALTALINKDLQQSSLINSC